MQKDVPISKIKLLSSRIKYRKIVIFKQLFYICYVDFFYILLIPIQHVHVRILQQFTFTNDLITKYPDKIEI